MQNNPPIDNVVASLLIARRLTDDEQAIRHINAALDQSIDAWGDTGTVPSSSNQGGPLSVGDEAPDFELPGVGSNGVEQFQLSEYTATGPVLLSFYPFDFSPVCTRQHCTFRQVEWSTVREEVDVFAISGDSVYCHRNFRDEYEFHFPLLTDRLASVAESFGVKYDTYEQHPAVCQRALFGIDEDRTVRSRWHTGDAMDRPSIADIEDTLAWA